MHKIRHIHHTAKVKKTAHEHDQGGSQQISRMSRRGKKFVPFYFFPISSQSLLPYSSVFPFRFPYSPFPPQIRRECVDKCVKLLTRRQLLSRA